MRVKFKCPKCGDDMLTERIVECTYRLVLSINEHEVLASAKLNSMGVGSIKPAYHCDQCGEFIAEGHDDLFEWLKKHNQVELEEDECETA